MRIDLPSKRCVIRIAAFATLLLVAASLSAQQSPVTMPFVSSTPPPEVPIGAGGHPFRAVVDANWTGTGASEPSLPAKARGEIWRDAIGDVRLDGLATRNGPNSPQLPDRKSTRLNSSHLGI